MAEKQRDLLKNEGEGSKTAAREYDKKAHRYSGDEPEAREAKDAVEEDEGELSEAEREAKKRAAEEDPKLYE